MSYSEAGLKYIPNRSGVSSYPSVNESDTPMTFSICVREERAEGTSFGVAVATDAPAVGALAPCVTHDGVISTQSFVNVRLGRRGVALLPDLGVDDALSGLLEQDDHSHLRQVHGLDVAWERLRSLRGRL